MQTVQSQNPHRRGPKLAIPLDADVASVRYYKFPPKKVELAAAKDKHSNGPYPPKIHLSFIPPSLRRPTPWSAFLTEWLSKCDDKKEEEREDTSCSSSTSGACSADTVTTDFSSISSPRAALEHGFAYAEPAPPAAQLPASVQPAQQASYPFRVPLQPNMRRGPRGAHLTPAQWAELLALREAAAPPKHAPPPPSLMNIHTAYLPELDAAVQQMMHPSSMAAPPRSQPGVFVPGQPWVPHSHYYPTQKRNPLKGASSLSGGSVDGSEYGVDRSLAACTFCYEHAVHEAHARPGAHLPRLSDRGHWRGHVLKARDVIVCPRLLRRVCPLCGATGQAAHLTTYCPVTKRTTAGY